MKQQADLMVELGFKDAGYEYVIVDDCWPNKEGRGVPNIFSKYSFVSIVFLKINSMNNYWFQIRIQGSFRQTRRGSLVAWKPWVIM